MKILSLFSGIGAFEKALTNLNEDFEVVNYCEIDKFAAKAYSIIHNIPESKNLGDITKINKEKLLSEKIDLITYGFPCQDISIAGLMKGFSNLDGSKTRSGLFFNALDLIQALQPKVAIAENVKNLTSKRFEKEFNIVLSSLDEAGYNNYWAVLNSKDYGVPQNRQRVFIVSIRKDINKHNFEFPKSIQLNKFLGDIVEKQVDKSFYLSKEKTSKVIEYGEKWCQQVVSPNAISSCLMERDYKEPSIICCANLNYSKFVKVNRVYSLNGIAPTLDTCGGGDLQAKIKQDGIYRKLTPKEYFRLMGFDDSDYEKLVEAGMSKTQLYKMAGNSIVVNVIQAILKQIIDYKII